MWDPPSPTRALAAADEQFGRIIAWLERNGNLDETDVIVVSDHGYATIDHVVDVEAELQAAGFPSGDPRHSRGEPRHSRGRGRPPSFKRRPPSVLVPERRAPSFPRTPSSPAQRQTNPSPF